MELHTIYEFLNFSHEDITTLEYIHSDGITIVSLFKGHKDN